MIFAISDEVVCSKNGESRFNTQGKVRKVNDGGEMLWVEWEDGSEFWMPSSYLINITRNLEAVIQFRLEV
jgi:hypothetical protein